MMSMSSQNNNKKVIQSSKFILAILSVAVLAGCAGTRTADPGATASHLASSNYQAIASQYMKDGKPSYDKENLIDSLEAAKAFNDAGMWKESREAFDIANNQLTWTEDRIDDTSKIANLIGTTLTSSAFGKYQGKIYEGGLIDYYQSINAIMMGDEREARVAFNRFDLRSTNAQSLFAAYSRAIKEENKKSLTGDTPSSASKSLSGISKEVAAGRADVPNRSANAKITNAAGQFMSGIFRATSSVTSDKEGNDISRGLNGAASSASSRAGSALASSTFRSIGNKGAGAKGKVFVLYEDGSGPTFSEFRIDLPLFLLTDKVTYTGIALPKFVPGKAAYGKLKVGDSNTSEMTNITLIAGMDFDVAYPGIVTKAVTSTVIKTAAQVAANAVVDQQVEDKFLGSLMKIGMGAAQAATTQADTRAWVNLPNTIQVAVLNKPSTNVLNIYNGNTKLLDVQLPSDDNVLVLIKASGVSGSPTAYVKGLPVKPDAELIANKN
jgi:hypothetical protein